MSVCNWVKTMCSLTYKCIYIYLVFLSASIVSFDVILCNGILGDAFLSTN